MAFRVFISHSVAPSELGAIYGIAELAAKRGMEPIVPDRRWAPDAVPARVAQLVKGLAAFVAIATRSGSTLAWINAELEQALASGLDARRVVSVIDADITPPSTDAVVILDRTNVAATIENTVSKLEQLQLEQRQQNLLAGLILGGLAALILASSD